MTRDHDLQFMKEYAEGTVEIDLAEVGDRVLASSDDPVAHALLRLYESSDRPGTWMRFEASLIRTYGPDWMSLARRDWRVTHAMSTLVCRKRGCMELAIGGVCDQCLTK